MTTVGYGDKAPVTTGGRLVALVWMFASILLISSITGAIASALTVDQLTGTLRSPKDLPRVRVGTVTDSTSETYLKRHHIAHRTFDGVSQGLDAILARDIDAMVYDAPLLQYTINRDYGEGLRVLPHTLQRQDYAIALPSGSGLREMVNRALETQIQSPEWEGTLLDYLGQQ
jgi:ABC-type amino acid transport substrate-binding protein